MRYKLGVLLGCQDVLTSWLSRLGDLPSIDEIQAGCSSGLPGCPDLLIVQTGRSTASHHSFLVACLPIFSLGREHDGACWGLILTFHREAKVPTSACEVVKINGPHSFRAHSINSSLAQDLEISVLGLTSINQLYQLLYAIL